MDENEQESQLIAGIPPDELADFQEWRRRVQGTNISDRTLLATDYLNHFNEIVMLIEMIPDMPEMLEDCYAWEPKSYQEHFRGSGFSDRALAVEAYEHVPSKFRRPFEDTIQQMNQVVRHTLERMSGDLENADPDRLRADCRQSVEMIHRIIQVANGIIHGTAHVMEQDEIDLYLGSA
ncbi:hypothetical protein [Azospirillum sp. A39]|uniref:hypothetical protein n=1 Tax=Azospirillum sp. A39 TaxID=3462279 RepID=UPI0040457882